MQAAPNPNQALIDSLMAANPSMAADPNEDADLTGIQQEGANYQQLFAANGQDVQLENASVPLGATDVQRDASGGVQSYMLDGEGVITSSPTPPVIPPADSESYPSIPLVRDPGASGDEFAATPGPTDTTGGSSIWSDIGNFFSYANNLGNTDHSFSDALYFPGIFGPARFNLGIASNLVNTPLNLLNSAANYTGRALGTLTEPFDRYQGELITTESAIPGGLGGVLEEGTTVLGATSRALRGGEAVAEAGRPAASAAADEEAGLSGAQYTDAPTIAPQLKRIEFDAGEKGAWNSGVNKTLEPNALYVDKTTGYAYTTDNLGRVTNVDGNLVLDTAERNTYQQRVVGGSDRLDTDQGGHLIASIFGGPGERINLVPMDANLNMGAWRSMEAGWASEIEAGNSVGVQVKPIYTGDSLRPDAFAVTYQVGSDGRPVTRFFNNKPGG